MFTISKSKTPRYFKGVKNVPCRYRTQPKSWISSKLFEESVKEIDRNFGDQKRKIALIIDNCSAHPDVPALGWVEPMEAWNSIPDGIFTNCLKSGISGKSMEKTLNDEDEPFC